jgi:hypothetical protein
MSENWRAIAGYAGYQVSDQGRVRSLDRVITRLTKRGPVPARMKGRIRKPSSAGNGYCIVTLGRARPYIHSLVLEAFVGPRPPGHQAAHGNGDRRDNRVENLRWATRDENEADKANHGTRLTGDRTPNGRKTQCRRGHPYDATNTMFHRGRRSCRTCRRDETRRRRQAIRVRQAEEARRRGAPPVGRPKGSGLFIAALDERDCPV